MCAQSRSTLCNPMDCSPPGSFVLGFPTQEYLQWVAISFSRGSFWPMDQTCVSWIGRQFLYHWVPGEAQYRLQVSFKKLNSWLKQMMHVMVPGLIVFFRGVIHNKSIKKCVFTASLLRFHMLNLFHSTSVLWGCFLFSPASNHSKCFPLPDSTSLFSFHISQVNVLKS